MKVVITGANGFVGGYLVDLFLSRGDEVVALGRFQTPARVMDDPRLTIHKTDFDRHDLTKILNNVDVIVHLAAMRTNVTADQRGIDPYYEANIRTTENLILAAIDCQVPRICQASSIAVYSPDNTVPYKETEAPIPLSYYGISKLACEHLAAVYMRNYPIDLLSLRFAQIFGYGESRGLSITKFIHQARSGSSINIWGEGKTARDYIYIKDVLSAIEQAIDKNTCGGVFNIGSNRPLSVNEMAEAVKTVFNNSVEIIHDLSKQEPGDIYFMDMGFTNKVLNWQPYWTFIHALQDMKEYYDKG